jgi:hypothetical protein
MIVATSTGEQEQPHLAVCCSSYLHTLLPAASKKILSFSSLPAKIKVILAVNDSFFGIELNCSSASRKPRATEAY